MLLKRFKCIFVAILLLPMVAFASPKEIIFWHSMAGQLGDALRSLTQQFNQAQTEYLITPIYKGDYIESLTSFAAAFRAKRPPSMIQVFEVGTSIMRTPPGVIKPVEQLMHEQGLDIPTQSFFPAVRENYSDQGQLMAMPLNISIPVMFYNADALAKLGVTTQNFPRTWDALEGLAKRLHESGYACAYTTAYPAWIFIESYSALHGLPMFEGDTATFNNKNIAAHLQRMRRWQKQHYFDYGGRTNDSTVLFTSGRCPLFSQSSGSYAGLSELVSFKVGVAPMPTDMNVSTTRHNNVVGGAAIWVAAGQSTEMERGIAEFLTFLAKPKVQQAWYDHTGYLPMEYEHHRLNIHPQTILDIAALDLGQNTTTSAFPKQGPQNQIRAINDQMLEAVFSGMTKPAEALNQAVNRANHALLRFRKNTR